MLNIDLDIYSDNKAKMIDQKEKNNEPFVNQIRKILGYYSAIPVEELATIILTSNINKKKKTEKITVKLESIKSENSHLRKVYLAILTKNPKLEYREMLLLLIDHYIKENYL